MLHPLRILSVGLSVTKVSFSVAKMGWETINVYAVIKGYHHYHVKPDVGDVLRCFPEADNVVDKRAVAVYDGDVTVGHVPATPIKLNCALLQVIEMGIPVIW